MSSMFAHIDGPREATRLALLSSCDFGLSFGLLLI
jgi:hypothetical protein